MSNSWCTPFTTRNLELRRGVCVAVSSRLSGALRETLGVGTREAMLPSRTTVWLFVIGLLIYLAALTVSALLDLIANWSPSLATTLGSLPIASAALSLVVGFDVCILLLFFLDALHARWSLALQVRRERPARLSLGAENEVTIVLNNPRPRAVRLRVRDEAPAQFRAEPPVLDAVVPGHGWTRLTYRLLPTDRGNFSFGPIYLRCRGVLGLAWIDRTIPAAETVQVYPNLLEIRRYEA